MSIRLKYVSVLGQVKSPGAYAIQTSRSILAVIALAGRLSDIADYNITSSVEIPLRQPVSYTSFERPPYGDRGRGSGLPGRYGRRA